MALWDFFGSTAGQQALGGFGASMLANSGWKPVNSPGTGFGEILGQGMQAGMQGYQQGQAQHEREVELGYQKRKRAEADQLARDQRLNDLAKQQEQIAARDYALKSLGSKVNPAEASLLRAQDPAEAGNFLMQLMNPAPTDPVKLGRGEVLIDPRTRQQIAQGLPVDEGITAYQQAQLALERDKMAMQAQQGGQLTPYQQEQVNLRRQELEQQAALASMTPLMRNLIASGLQPGSPEFRDAVVRAETRPLIGQDSGPKLPGGYSWADPNDRSKGVVPLPGGPDDPTTAKPTEQQARNAPLLESIDQSLATIDQLTNSGFDPARGGGWKGVAQGTAEEVAPQFMKPADRQKYEQAYRSAIQNVLYVKTGAAAPIGEVENNMKIYLPTSWDSPETARQKRADFEQFLNSARTAATPGGLQQRAAAARDGGDDADPLGIR